MNTEHRADFENIPEGARIRLHPADANLIHREPVLATRIGNYFYCDDSDPERQGPDYHLGDVAAFFAWFDLVGVTA